MDFSYKRNACDLIKVKVAGFDYILFLRAMGYMCLCKGVLIFKGIVWAEGSKSFRVILPNQTFWLAGFFLKENSSGSSSS